MDLLTHTLPNSYLRNYSTLRVGGISNYLFAPQEVSDLSKIICAINDKNLECVPIGGGSNILFGDVNKIALISDRNLKKKIRFDNNIVSVSANVNINVLISECKNRELSGLEFLIGIPAHIGGLTKMNAGAFGKEISALIKNVTFVDKNGSLQILDKNEILFSYRSSSLEGFITEVTFELQKESSLHIRSELSRYIGYRISHQPLNYPNIGSFFKNPEGDFAGRLIEAVGLKGFSIGDAAISRKHANFIINKGNATFENVISVMKKVQTEVYNEFGIYLEPEVRIIDDETKER